jgi:DNA-binding NarL/FixJ family response regulator
MVSPAEAAGRAPAVLIVDDHQFVGEGLEAVLRAHGFDAHRSACRSCAEIMDEAAAHEVIVLDLDLGPVGDGRDLVAPLTELGCAVVVLTGQQDPLRLATCVEQGASAITSKAAGFGEIVDVVTRAAAGEPVMSDAARTRYLAELADHRRQLQQNQAPFQRLSHQEARVLTRIMDGKSAEEIAEDLYVSLNTVRTQIRGILRKLDVGSQLAAAAMARHHGWQGVAE